MSTEWARLINTTTPKYIRQVESNIIRKRKLLALMESKGRIKMNCSGTELNWKVEYKQPPLNTFDDTQSLDYTRRDRYKTAEIGFKSYYVSDMMTEMERLQNSGQEAIIKSYSEIISSLTRAIRDQFGDELYKNGYDSSNTRCLHGVESMFGTDATPTKLNNGFVQPNTTYAGLHTLPQYYGGTWSGSGLAPGTTSWPVGTGDPHYDFFSPILVNYTDSTSGVWSASTKTWQNTCQEALRKGIAKSTRSSATDGKLDLILMNEELFEQFKNSIPVEFHITRGQPVGLAALGFSDAINFDGIDVASEYGIPASTAYGINTMEMELQSLQSSLFVPRGPDFDNKTYSWQFSIAFMGNMRFNPKFFVKWYAWGN